MIKSRYYFENKTIVKKFFLLVFSIFIVLGCSNNKEKSTKIKSSAPLENTLSKAEIDDGWELLFDGKTFNGWRGIGKNTVPDGHWKIEDNCIRKIKSGDVPILADGQPAEGGDLMTDRTFDNFELSFDWKISEAGNSGVKYNVIEEYSVKNGSTSALGYEYQVLDDEKHEDNLNPTHRTASLYDMIQAIGGSAKPIGEFNTGRIVFNKNHGEHWLNGVKVVEYDVDSPEFQEHFKKSKYAKHEDFTKHKIAHLILQDHGNDCWYKNIKIRKLN
jgi:hypothetical protein